jgi:hypothetical protein
MTAHTLTRMQKQAASAPLDARVFLHGPAGAGKTAAAAARLASLLRRKVRADSILVLLPQRTLAGPYTAVLNQRSAGRAASRALAGREVPQDSPVSIVTMGGLARRMVDVFWPVAAEAAGFTHPDQPPTFLTLETAQYFMAYLVRPLLDGGLFSSVTLDRNRLYSQILDNLNKAAFNDFPFDEIGPRLKSAWSGDRNQLRVYDDVQKCAAEFRGFCLANNLLDYSLQLEVFAHHIWQLDMCQDYLRSQYRHLIYDNVEEDTLVAHRLVSEWCPAFDSLFIVQDDGAGYRRFLGADPPSAAGLAQFCRRQLAFTDSFVTTPPIQSLAGQVALSFKKAPPAPAPDESPADGAAAAEAAAADSALARAAFEIGPYRFQPQMVEWVCASILRLVKEEHVPPGQIAVLSPYLSDSLRFTLANRLAQLEIPAWSQRPSRSLRDEPVTQALLTLTALAHPGWGVPAPPADVMLALAQSIAGLDLVRAGLLTDILLRKKDGAAQLGSFEKIRPDMQARITYQAGAKFETLRAWIDAYRAGAPQELDYFISRLFGEVLAQPGFGFHQDLDAGRITANLVESIQKFRRVIGPALAESSTAPGQEYLAMLADGVIAAQYLPSQPSQPGAVLVAPAHTFLLGNAAVDFQFWLDVGGRGWWERLYQPLTHPYVLSSSWTPGQVWTDLQEYEINQENMYLLISGLLRRCRRGVYLAYAELGEQGYEQNGPLLQVIAGILKRTRKEGI